MWRSVCWTLSHGTSGAALGLASVREDRADA
jgi:hypothetical protein